MPRQNKTGDKLTIRRIEKNDGKIFLSLIAGLADYENLVRPNASAQKRLLRDGFGEKKRFDGYLAFMNEKAVGYAILFETYSSFLALPTLYLEDIFILPGYRSKGIGKELFRVCLKEAQKRECGRMEWVVLDWNRLAIKFYQKIFNPPGSSKTFRYIPRYFRKKLASSQI